MMVPFVEEIIITVETAVIKMITNHHVVIPMIIGDVEVVAVSVAALTPEEEGEVLTIIIEEGDTTTTITITVVINRILLEVIQITIGD
jgi:hypothetical protein